MVQTKNTYNNYLCSKNYVSLSLSCTLNTFFFSNIPTNFMKSSPYNCLFTAISFATGNHSLSVKANSQFYNYNVISQITDILFFGNNT